VLFDAARRRVCAGGDDGVALCWDLARAEVIRCCRVPNRAAGIRALSLTADGRYLAAAYAEPLIRVWDLDTEVVAVSIRPPDGRAVWSVRFSADDRFLVMGCTDRIAAVVDRRGAELTRLLHQPEATDGTNLIAPQDVHAAVFSPDGRWVATAASDGLVRVFDPRGAVVTRLPHPGVALAVEFRPDGRRVATGAADGNARVWDPTARLVGRLNHGGPVRAVAYTPDSRWLATGSADGTARLWQDDQTTPSAWARHGGEVGGVALGAAGLLATASADHTVRVWAPGEALGAGR
jgi:WD40 repeat protein